MPGKRDVAGEKSSQAQGGRTKGFSLLVLAKNQAKRGRTRGFHCQSWHKIEPSRGVGQGVFTAGPGEKSSQAPGVRTEIFHCWSWSHLRRKRSSREAASGRSLQELRRWEAVGQGATRAG